MPLIFGIIAGGLALIKLGALAALVAVFALALKFTLAIIFMLTGMLGWRHIQKP
jgi:hypothetical protein